MAVLRRTCCEGGSDPGMCLMPGLCGVLLYYSPESVDLFFWDLKCLHFDYVVRRVLEQRSLRLFRTYAVVVDFVAYSVYNLFTQQYICCVLVTASSTHGGRFMHEFVRVLHSSTRSV